MGEGWGEEGRRPNQRTSLGLGPACVGKSGGSARAPTAFLPEVCDPWGACPLLTGRSLATPNCRLHLRGPSRDTGQDGVLHDLGHPSRTPRPGGLCGDLGPWQRQASSPRAGKGSGSFRGSPRLPEVEAEGVAPRPCGWANNQLWPEFTQGWGQGQEGPRDPSPCPPMSRKRGEQGGLRSHRTA